MQLSLNLPDDDVKFLDSYARSIGADSRSAVVHRAVQLLRATELESAYEAAWLDWHDPSSAG